MKVNISKFYKSLVKFNFPLSLNTHRMHACLSKSINIEEKNPDPEYETIMC